MMRIIELESWEAYCSAVDELRPKYENIPVLFRGQPNSNWRLRTTIERYSKTSWTIREYCNLVVDCVRDLGSFDDYTGDIPSLSDIDRERSAKGDITFTERMKRKIDSAVGRVLYSMRLAISEPPFSHITSALKLDRFTLRGKTKVYTQWNLFCIVHNVKLTT